MPRNAAESAACIWVLAGANGAGKSSIAGAFLRENGGDFYNPDEIARRILEDSPGLGQADANSLAWRKGVELLRTAVANRHDFVFETTLGGDTVSRLLAEALDAGVSVRIWYIGLASPEMHVKRVAARVRHGGHPIPDELIHRRFDQARLNLIRLAPRLAELRVFDNSAEADPMTGTRPRPRLVIHVSKRRVVAPKDLRATPEWAKPIVVAILKSAAK